MGKITGFSFFFYYDINFDIYIINIINIIIFYIIIFIFLLFVLLNIVLLLLLLLFLAIARSKGQHLRQLFKMHT